MNPSQVVEQAKSKMQLAVDHLRAELSRLRTGRAHASMLEGLTVEAYGTRLPLNQAATVTAPEAQLLQITPFDPGNLAAISAAIRNNSSLGMNPSDDGRVVRVPVPPLNEERRRELARTVGQKQEECMVGLRAIRHEAMDAIDKAKKAKQLGEDDAKRLEKQVDDAIGKARAEAEAAATAKEKEIMTV